jgi:hypothetical protein
VLGLLYPSQAFGPNLRPLIGLAVAIVVFEGGLANAEPGGEDLGGDPAGDDAEDRRRHTLFHTQRSLRVAG